MRYAKMFPNSEFEINTFSCVLAHHIRQHPDRKDCRAMSIDEYSKIVGAPVVYVKALALAADHPSELILDEMGLVLDRHFAGKLRNKNDE